MLLTLDTLLIEHNVTRAAERLNLSQPSVSVQLGKLREILGDPLLLPGPRGMLPTARANQLREPLRHALEALEHAIMPASPFTPETATHTWRVSATDYMDVTVLLPMLQGLYRAAPHTRLAVLDMVPVQIARQLEHGEIDLAFHTRHDSPLHLHQRLLFKEHYVLVGRVGHPQLHSKLTLAQFCALGHVLVSPDGGGFYGVTDTVLAALGLSRHVVLSVPHFLFATTVLANTDLVSVLPSRLVRDNPQLQMIEPPIEVPGFEMAMLWHERSHRDPAHQWLREFMVRSLL
ncbi:LysR family transcriptional regulator [Aquirhabdus sp.]|uniref:LysR family transcriptional regulator n=1 Tax=Aquirhabdus sp. TaxID=2824160 RepID=UPI00396CDD51